VFVEGEHVPLKEGTMIEILGTRLIFKGTKDDSLEEGEKVTKENIKDVVMSDTSNDNKYNNEMPIKELEQEEKDKLDDKEEVVKKEDDDIPIENLKVPTKSTRNKKPKKLEDEIIKVLGKEK
jgi:hypothetical protein